MTLEVFGCGLVQKKIQMLYSARKSEKIHLGVGLLLVNLASYCLRYCNYIYTWMTRPVAQK